MIPILRPRTNWDGLKFQLPGGFMGISVEVSGVPPKLRPGGGVGLPPFLPSTDVPEGMDPARYPPEIYRSYSGNNWRKINGVQEGTSILRGGYAGLPDNINRQDDETETGVGGPNILGRAYGAESSGDYQREEEDGSLVHAGGFTRTPTSFESHAHYPGRPGFEDRWIGHRISWNLSERLSGEDVLEWVTSFHEEQRQVGENFAQRIIGERLWVPLLYGFSFVIDHHLAKSSSRTNGVEWTPPHEFEAAWGQYVEGFEERRRQQQSGLKSARGNLALAQEAWRAQEAIRKSWLATLGPITDKVTKWQATLAEREQAANCAAIVTRYHEAEMGAIEHFADGKPLDESQQKEYDAIKAKRDTARQSYDEAVQQIEAHRASGASLAFPAIPPEVYTVELARHAVTSRQAEVIALELLEQYNLAHENLAPGNVFVNGGLGINAPISASYTHEYSWLIPGGDIPRRSYNIRGTFDDAMAAIPLSKYQAKCRVVTQVLPGDDREPPAPMDDTMEIPMVALVEDDSHGGHFAQGLRAAMAGHPVSLRPQWDLPDEVGGPGRDNADTAGMLLRRWSTSVAMGPLVTWTRGENWIEANMALAPTRIHKRAIVFEPFSQGGIDYGGARDTLVTSHLWLPPQNRGWVGGWIATFSGAPNKYFDAVSVYYKAATPNSREENGTWMLGANGVVTTGVFPLWARTRRGYYNGGDGDRGSTVLFRPALLGVAAYPAVSVREIFVPPDVLSKHTFDSETYGEFWNQIEVLGSSDRPERTRYKSCRTTLSFPGVTREGEKAYGFGRLMIHLTINEDRAFGILCGGRTAAFVGRLMVRLLDTTHGSAGKFGKATVVAEHAQFSNMEIPPSVGVREYSVESPPIERPGCFIQFVELRG